MIKVKTPTSQPNNAEPLNPFVPLKIPMTGLRRFENELAGRFCFSHVTFTYAFFSFLYFSLALILPIQFFSCIDDEVTSLSLQVKQLSTEKLLCSHFWKLQKLYELDPNWVVQRRAKLISKIRFASIHGQHFGFWKEHLDFKINFIGLKRLAISGTWLYSLHFNAA